MLPQLKTQFYCAQLFWMTLSFTGLWAFLHFWAVPVWRKILHARHRAVHQMSCQVRLLTRQTEALEKEDACVLQKAQSDATRLMQTAIQNMHAALKQKEKEMRIRVKCALDVFQPDSLYDACETRAFKEKIARRARLLEERFLLGCGQSVGPKKRLFSKEHDPRVHR